MDDFQSLLLIISAVNIGTYDDYRWWSIDPSGIFSVKSLTQNLASSSPLEKELFSAIWKSKSPKRINILLWIMINGSFNTSEILQKKLPSNCIMTSVCSLCFRDEDSLDHVFVDCSFARFCRFKLFEVFYLQWVFSNVFRSNIT